MNSIASTRLAHPRDFQALGQLMVDVYSKIEGFPSIAEQPGYYNTLAHVGELTKNPGTDLLVAVYNDEIVGGVVYIGNVKYYGAKSSATQEENTAGIRLLAVRSDMGGKGIGRALTEACLQRARDQGRSKVILHTTRSMPIAWRMYEKIGFVRKEKFDFVQDDLEVFGFELLLTH